jgi:hypothetical protein
MAEGILGMECLSLSVEAVKGTWRGGEGSLPGTPKDI